MTFVVFITIVISVEFMTIIALPQSQLDHLIHAVTLATSPSQLGHKCFDNNTYKVRF